MTKTSVKEQLKRAKEQAGANMENITFRINKHVVEEFKTYCDIEKVKQSILIEILIKDHIGL